MTDKLSRGLTLVCAGLLFGLSQLQLLRELGSLLYGEEVVLWLVSSVALASAAVGYQLGGRLSRTALVRVLVVCALFHLASPHWLRLAFAEFCRLREGTGPELFAVAAIAAAVSAIPFCALLPALLPKSGSKDRVAQLRLAYGCELTGFALGTSLALWWGDLPTLRFAVQTADWTLLLALVTTRHGAPTTGFMRNPHTWLAVWLLLATPATAFHGQLGLWSLTQVYVYKHRITDARVLWSVDSTYQRVEVVDAPRTGRMLYLDGLRNLDAGSLDTLNHYLARLPAKLRNPAHTLLLGNGTLSMVEELAGLSGQLTSVEIDPAVVDAGARFFTPGEPLTHLTNWHLYYTDGKAWLAATNQRYDLIVVDVPSPLTLGESYLHTQEFYELCASRLTDRGLVSVQLSGSIGNPKRTPARIVAGLRAAFAEVVVVESTTADRSFAYASPQPIDPDMRIRSQQSSKEQELVILRGETLTARISGAQPLRLDDLDLVLRRGLERLLSRHGWGQ